MRIIFLLLVALAVLSPDDAAAQAIFKCVENGKTPFMLRLGRREVLVTRDFRKRFYPVNPIIECDTGVEPGHVEVLLLRRWLLILSKAH